jgi:hypothetical protein
MHHHITRQLDTIPSAPKIDTIFSLHNIKNNTLTTSCNDNIIMSVKHKVRRLPGVITP